MDTLKTIDTAERLQLVKDLFRAGRLEKEMPLLLSSMDVQAQIMEDPLIKR